MVSATPCTAPTISCHRSESKILRPFWTTVSSGLDTGLRGSPVLGAWLLGLSNLRASGPLEQTCPHQTVRHNIENSHSPSCSANGCFEDLNCSVSASSNIPLHVCNLQQRLWMASPTMSQDSNQSLDDQSLPMNEPFLVCSVIWCVVLM
jgi:hypothetical protein